jgi:hypothetical protein
MMVMVMEIERKSSRKIGKREKNFRPRSRITVPSQEIHRTKRPMIRPAAKEIANSKITITVNSVARAGEITNPALGDRMGEDFVCVGAVVGFAFLPMVGSSGVTGDGDEAAMGAGRFAAAGAAARTPLRAAGAMMETF